MFNSKIFVDLFCLFFGRSIEIREFSEVIEILVFIVSVWSEGVIV